MRTVLETPDAIARPVWLCEALIEVEALGGEQSARDRLTHLLSSLRAYGVVHCEVKVLEKIE